MDLLTLYDLYAIIAHWRIPCGHPSIRNITGEKNAAILGVSSSTILFFHFGMYLFCGDQCAILADHLLSFSRFLDEVCPLWKFTSNSTSNNRWEWVALWFRVFYRRLSAEKKTQERKRWKFNSGHIAAFFLAIFWAGFFPMANSFKALSAAPDKTYLTHRIHKEGLLCAFRFWARRP